MNVDTRARFGDELYEALRARKTVKPLTERESDVTVSDAYGISLRMLERRLADGERVIGKKIGVTSKPVQRMLDVHTPDFGYLTDRMQSLSSDERGAQMPISTQLIQPRAEGEIAFTLKRDLEGPGITPEDVLAATESVHPCFEVVDSRIEGWRIKYQDTVADNASSGMFVIGAPADPRAIDFYGCGIVVEKNGEIISTGAGAAALGSPLICVAWLANTLAGYEVSLKAGEIILSGSLVPLEPVVPGDRMKLVIAGVGRASVDFV